MDVGTVRIGVAASDPDGILATPVATVARPAYPNPDRPGRTRSADIVEIARIVSEYGAVEVIVGLPITLSGIESFAADAARQYADRLAAAVAPVPVRLVDERLSTAAATRRLAEQGVKGRRRRTVVDQAAAVEILQSWLDSQRRRSDA